MPARLLAGDQQRQLERGNLVLAEVTAQEIGCVR
jgi:hypothetical protein